MRQNDGNNKQTAKNEGQVTREKDSEGYIRGRSCGEEAEGQDTVHVNGDSRGKRSRCPTADSLIYLPRTLERTSRIRDVGDHD